MIVRKDFRDPTIPDIDTIARGVVVDQIPYGEIIVTFDNVEDLNHRIEKRFGVLSDQIEIRIPAFDFAVWACMRKIFGEHKFQLGNIPFSEGIEPRICQISVHDHPPVKSCFVRFSPSIIF